MTYRVLYYSETGNTEKIAKAIYEALPGEDKDIRKFGENMKEEADLYLIGFWVNNGTCSMELLDYLSELENKKIALFGTCGLGGDTAYYKQIENQMLAWLPVSNTYLGSFFCQGKMPISVRKYYETKNSASERDRYQKLIENFDRAMLHPDAEDVKHAQEFVKKVLAK